VTTRSAVYVDGSYAEPGAPAVPAVDRGLLLGDGVFESLPVVAGRPWLLERHVARLARSAEALGIRFDPAGVDWEEITDRLRLRTGSDDAYLRITLTRGDRTASGLGLDPDARPRLIISASPFVMPAPGETWAVAIASERRDPSSPVTRHKTLSYLSNVLAREAARSAGADEAVFLSTSGRIQEGTTTNFFIVRSGRVLTPPVSDGLLEGIARGRVLELAREAGVEAGAESLVPPDAGSADEVFLTNSLRGVIGVRRFSERELADAPGPLTRRLAEGVAADFGRGGG
jgi:branched-chain amino acid aminotransferase